MKTKVVLLLSAVLFFSCEKEVHYAYKQFSVTNGTAQEFTVYFDAKDYRLEPGGNVIIEFERCPVTESRNIMPADFTRITDKLSVCRVIDSEKNCVPKEKYSDMKKWELQSHHVTTPEEQYKKEIYVMTFTEDAFSSEQ